MATDTESPDSLIGALRDLVQSEGWRLLKAQCDTEWGPAGYGRRMQEALAQVPAGPDRAYEIARVAEQVDATARAVNALVTWPTEEIKRLSPSQKSANPLQALRRIGR